MSRPESFENNILQSFEVLESTRNHSTGVSKFLQHLSNWQK
ncbi:hypothetical protein NC653_040513 [Populus alba x Populus x berolinensis]|uniref:Uncharacterized protein n=1 Tax=Populus alba x Populus x berolinensis TaxID=444605 RepID=A0AAD6L6A6_9ROSI|nr:hypothetical protein NC653_040513 [Populus alba x Populus x berolinensis]